MAAPAAAQSVENRIVLFGDAAQEVPADEATLQVNLSFSDERDIKPVYGEHEKARLQLVDLLEQSKIPLKDIQFSQLLTRRGRDSYRGQPGERFTSYQRAMIKFTDLDRLREVQQTLTTGGFTDLTATFSVSNQRQIELDLMEKAIGRAKEKASQAAKATSRTIKRIVRVSDVGENEGFYSYRENFRANLPQNQVSYDNDALRQMMTIPQVFRFSALVRVDFELNE
ncbi:hypothetical protein GCM10007390_47210 [Persicitalea jodogahamensis]|uniref:DUF541 domain-containing protein n=1 Tax=Persicitalea jodogahamensis TaxID=402147 RepID=A0A8J3DDA0_9BACT|nr:hypothetical protein GCM10007390_47210 [Persicitalea jodogahamensis]